MQGEEAEGGPEWVPVGVGSSLFPDAITSALATPVWWLHSLPGHIPGICSVRRLKSDHVSPYLPMSPDKYNALPWSTRAAHEPALAHQSCSLLCSLHQPPSGSLFSGLSSNVPLPKWPPPQPLVQSHDCVTIRREGAFDSLVHCDISRSHEVAGTQEVVSKYLPKDHQAKSSPLQPAQETILPTARQKGLNPRQGPASASSWALPPFMHMLLQAPPSFAFRVRDLTTWPLS